MRGQFYLKNLNLCDVATAFRESLPCKPYIIALFYIFRYLEVWFVLGAKYYIEGTCFRNLHIEVLRRFQKSQKGSNSTPLQAAVAWYRWNLRQNLPQVQLTLSASVHAPSLQ